MPIVREANPTVKHSDIAKMIGVKWSQVTPEEKEIYVQKANEDKKRFEREKAEETRLNGGEPLISAASKKAALERLNNQ